MYVCMYIYIYRERERERERYTIKQTLDALVRYFFYLAPFFESTLSMRFDVCFDFVVLFGVVFL